MSKSFERPLKYVGYIKNPLTLIEIELAYKIKKIDPARAELYGDFVQSLCDLIFMTYLGDKHHPNSIDRLNHFKWCWEKTQANYDLMGYSFSKGKQQFEYFETFFVDVYYFAEEKDDILEDSIKNVWGFIFNYNIVKSKLDVDNFIEIYNMFEKSEWYK